jgi:hypothetical protein
MAALALIDAEIWAGPIRLGTVANQVSLELTAAALDVTTFTSGGWRQFIEGLDSATVVTDGFMDAAPPETGALAPDTQIWSEVGGATQVPVVLAPTGADQQAAYVVPTRRGTVSLFGKVDTVAPFKSTMWGDGKIGRGNVIHPANVVRTTSGTGTTAVLGTVPAGKSLLVAVNVFTVAGTTPSLTITVQSDDNAGFTSPATVATVGPTVAPTAALVTVAGPITPDDRYRVTWTLTGTTPSARFGVAVGITQ